MGITLDMLLQIVTGKVVVVFGQDDWIELNYQEGYDLEDVDHLLDKQIIDLYGDYDVDYYYGEVESVFTVVHLEMEEY